MRSLFLTYTKVCFILFCANTCTAVAEYPGHILVAPGRLLDGITAKAVTTRKTSQTGDNSARTKNNCWQIKIPILTPPPIVLVVKWGET